MYDLIAYGDMIADKGRTSAYARALESLVVPESVVLDIGTGAGILALLACRAGAARVYAVEAGGVIAVAREAAAANGFADRIRFIQAESTAVDLPERVDGIVSDIHGVLPLFQSSVVSILDARGRLLRPGGWIVPERETLWAALFTSVPTHQQVVEAWNTEYGFDLSGARWRAANQSRRHRFAASDLISAPQRWATLDYRTMAGPNVDGEISWVVERPAIGHGIASWFDCEMQPGIGFSNAPASSEQHVYSQTFFAWPEAVSLERGDAVRVRLRAHLVGDSYVWSWATDVTAAATGGSKASYRQSSLLAEFLAPDIHKRADSFVADLGEVWRIDQHILELMGRQMPLGEIATEVLKAFPSAFKDWNAALGQVGVLSDRYSR